MKKTLIFLFLFSACGLFSQSNPAITRWLQNNSITARHYVAGNSTPINDASLVNVQSVKYSGTSVYVTTTGLPAYVTGPFLDGNPSLATNQNAIFKFPLAPVQNTGTPVNTTGGNIGVFINGVALFDYRDGVSWQNSTSSLKGGPLGGTGDGVWNRDAVVGERIGFDCSKGHPAMGNYHHHQNPSAFKLDLNVISNVCNLYTSDALYTIDSTQHSPLLGFAYDGFPIYGAYGYKNTDGTGGIVRMKSSFSLRNITVRNTYYTGASVTPGPNVSITYPLGYFREDYQFNPTSSATPDYLDDHNGRFCVTPEYPNGTYCYFATVNASWNSAYPYVVGPTFYGTKTALKVASIAEPVTTFPVNTTPSIYIAASAKTICAGANVSFTSAVYNAGLLPSYQWKKNGINVGSNSKTFSANDLTNGDVITCVLTTSSQISASSNSITFVVTANLTPSVDVTASATTICPGGQVVFTANAINGGITPSYQWKKNGINVGSGTTSYSDSGITASDVITCVMGSSLTCKTSATATSAPVSVTMKPAIECYCVPQNNNGICISNVVLSSLNQSGPSCVAPYYSKLQATTTLYRGASATISVTSVSSAKISLWIDYNRNGEFEISEWNQVSAATVAGVPSALTFTVPTTSATGITGIRVRSSNLSIPNGAADACTAFSAGECEDYYIIIENQAPQLSARVFLNTYNVSQGKMNDDLRVLYNFPLTDPYSAAPFSGKFIHVNNGAAASLNPNLLAAAGNNSLVDWVFLELRSATNAGSVVSTRSALLQADGDIVDADGVSPVTFNNTTYGNYYLAVRHRNHLGIRTAAPISLGSTVSMVNLTNNSVPVHGNNPLKWIAPSLAVMHGGDANSDGSVDAIDSVIWGTQNGLFDDYNLNADYNTDGSADSIDSIIWENANGLYEEL